MHFQFTHFISIYEIIKNPHDGGKKITLEKKKKTTLERIALPTTKQSNSLTGQNTDDYVTMRKLVDLIE